MDAGQKGGVLRLALGLGALLGTALGGCQGEERRVGPVCPTCEPHAGGETGDFKASLVPCVPEMIDEEVSEAEAVALGFDAPELRRRIARRVDGPLSWRPSTQDEASLGGGPASGYEPSTHVVLTFSESGALHHVHPDLAACDGTTCTLPDGTTAELAPCVARLEVYVSAELETEDQSVRATLEGRAGWMPDSAAARWQDPYYYLRADLTRVTGRLRLAPSPAAAGHTGLLFVNGFMESDATHGTISPAVRKDPNEVSMTGYWPLRGVF